ncbi:MAG TPA: alpha/beta hydrolase [Gaiellaceae bacterium]|nr:alpha/beta hydrolase [Gaiellaceae bacterium]
MRVQVRDVRLYFDVAGMGLVPDGAAMRERPVLICLHGGPGFDHSLMKETFSPLADLAQVVLPDQRGNGRSDWSTTDRWTLDTWIDDVPAFCEALEIERPVLLGGSFGGFVALGVAGRYPELPAKLVLLSTAARFLPERALAMFERLGGAEARDVAARYFEHPNLETREAYQRICLPLYNPGPPDPEAFARVVKHHEVGVHFWTNQLPELDLSGEASRVRCPTLILGGELDPLATPADLEELAAAIPGSQLTIVPGTGHGLRNKPDEAAASVRRFLTADTS